MQAAILIRRPLKRTVGLSHQLKTIFLNDIEKIDDSRLKLEYKKKTCNKYNELYAQETLLIDDENNNDIVGSILIFEFS